MPPGKAAMLLRDAANYLKDVVSASGQESDSVREAAGEAVARCEAALRAMAAGVPTNAPSGSRAEAAAADPAGGSGGFLGGGGGGLSTANALFGWAERQFGGNQRR